MGVLSIFVCCAVETIGRTPVPISLGVDEGEPSGVVREILLPYVS